MKRTDWIAVALVLVMVVALAGCAAQQAKTGGTATVTCPGCGRTYNTESALAEGKSTIECQVCGHTLRIRSY
ncbi:MAG: hypothetical protein V2A58_09670 [Planctomycetota bacterium]